MAPPFRAEQIGSLLRPAPLIAARSAAMSDAAGTHIQTLPLEVQRLTDEAIAYAVRKQDELSIRPFTSGEYERHIFYSGMFEKLGGFEVLEEIPIVEGFRTKLPSVAILQSKGVKTRPGIIATGKISHVKDVYMSEWEGLKKLLPESKWHECKLTIPSITWQHLQLAKGTAYTPAAYTSDNDYFTDLAAAYAAEIKSLHAAGLRSIQIDDPNLTYFLTTSFTDGCELDGIDADELLDLYIWAHNQCLKDLPADMHIGIHLCRGNMVGSTHIVSGSYERIAKKMFTELEYQSFYLEYESERAGDFEPLRHLPIGKNVVLGVISSKNPELEDLGQLEEKTYAAADVIARGQGRSRQEVLRDVLGVSPQCGFASMSKGGGIGMSEERMWEKLVLCRKLAERIWGEEVVKSSFVSA